MTTNHIKPITGNCLCGDTTILLDTADTGEQVRTPSPFLSLSRFHILTQTCFNALSQIACHCQDCKQSSGSAFSTNVLVLQNEVTIRGPIKTYESKAPSGNIVQRIFCSKCGSPITHKSEAFGDAQAIQTGNFKQFSRVPFHSELFTKNRWSGLGEIPGARQVAAMV
ncbi:putative glutathione-dependent formaldehyde-activating enzyme [Lyophyllum shimeji]|uniref:Glutathione-dependent formaldehyde-activating enzyme n=1 Tax=Lyophyllum shimeji TaxID=47721 RepID=A0A9P3PTE3_LYOSH|nr:putative glutathione-dependent formaldehyde-activating enzyme [Lyophyllum shimeji]